MALTISMLMSDSEKDGTIAGGDDQCDKREKLQSQSDFVTVVNLNAAAPADLPLHAIRCTANLFLQSTIVSIGSASSHGGMKW